MRRTPITNPLRFVLIFPRGELGSTVGIGHANLSNPANTLAENADEDGIENMDDDESGGTVSQRQYYCYIIQERDGSYLHFYRRLLHEFLVDQYAKIDFGRLSFIRWNQDILRADLYHGAADAVEAGDVDGRQIGQRIVLPSSFTGGPRYMYQKFQDAVAIVRALGKPELFITFTCNPNWPEITEALTPPQTSADRCDLVCRVFHEKLNCLMDDIRKGVVLGRVVGAVYVIEFQKRGLPHAHILVILDPRDKPASPEDYDKIVCAEIPDPETHPLLYETVRHHMVHRPCGNHNPTAPCMENKRCNINFPKDFRSETTVNEETGYVMYRRRDDGRFIGPGATSQITQDNRWVVPYNPFLLHKYNAHINVEICSSANSVKCIYINTYTRAMIEQMSASLRTGSNKASPRCTTKFGYTKMLAMFLHVRVHSVSSGTAFINSTHQYIGLKCTFQMSSG